MLLLRYSTQGDRGDLVVFYAKGVLAYSPGLARRGETTLGKQA